MLSLKAPEIKSDGMVVESVARVRSNSQDIALENGIRDKCITEA